MSDEKCSDKHMFVKLCETKHKELEQKIALHVSAIGERIHAIDMATVLRKDALDAKLDGMDKALNIKAIELERRLEGLNQLRADVVRDREEFVRKDTYMINHKSLELMTNLTTDRINVIGNRILVLETRSVVWTVAIGVFFIICQIALHFWSNMK